MSKTNIIIDLDGTIYRGDQLLDHAKSFIDILNKNNINYKFFTNCSKNVPKGLGIKLKKMGLEVQESNIITSGCIAQRYIQSMDKQALVYVIGSNSFKEYLQMQNVSLANGTDCSADYVLVGFCTDFTYDELTRALWHIQSGAIFITTNLDETIPSGKYTVPHTGAISAFLEYASKQKPLNMGKPSEYAGNYFREIFGSDQVFVIGDRIDTDMLFAKNNDFTACLVLTGITSQKDIDSIEQPYFQTFNDLQEFYNILERQFLFCK
ncbi:MAG: HAD-IIA family hydrolase [Spirochaetaceae bacterium]|nr:HAD-IIA family hydrolase [Spirochaetaceae bacterium]